MPNNIDSLFSSDTLATTITDLWTRWDSARTTWLKDRKELREYLFATSTRDTTNKQLPWKNSTVTPKLTQIRDNLHANYMAALFPNEDWFDWVAEEKTPDLFKKRQAIVAYMKQKLRASKFPLIISQLIYDYIDYGNVFVGHHFVQNIKSTENGDITLYVGPKAFRVSPTEVVMNPLAEDFANSPMIRRVLKNIGDLIQDVETKPNLNYSSDVVQKCLDLRASYRDNPDIAKNSGLIVDGFGTIDEYLSSGTVELLEFWGDIYDPSTGEYHKDMVVTVADRKWILRKQPNESWLGHKPFYHCGWRLRPDNLWAQGPLDQLVGMQYRIDHLENLKADVFDQIAHPLVKIKGTTVEEFQFGPGEEIFVGDEGDVEFMRPDATALNADMQIQELMNRMEELAGAPKQAMGFRTPGEKTKYEVQSLENAAGRIFQSKIEWFERNILEPLINSMLEESVRNMSKAEPIKIVDPELGAEIFVDVTKKDLTGNGTLYPMGARHFADKAKFIQNLTQTLQIVYQIDDVATHISGKAIAQAINENMGWEAYNIVKDNVRISERADTQSLQRAAAEQEQVEANVPVEGFPMGQQPV